MTDWAEELRDMNHQLDAYRKTMAEDRLRLKERCFRMKAILEDLEENEPCFYDHHGYCQAHGWFETDPVCPQKRLRDILGEYDAE